MKYRRVICLSLAAFLLAIAYDIHRGAFGQPVPVPADVCNIAVKRSIPIAVSTSVTVPLVSSSTFTAPLTICGVSMGIAASATLQFVAGTGAACATDQESVSGVYPAGAYNTNPQGTYATVPTGKDLCVKGTGTGGGGALTYVLGGLPQPTSTQTPTTSTQTPTATPT